MSQLVAMALRALSVFVISGLGFSSIAAANFDDVVVNGNKIDPQEFEAYKRHAIVDEFCAPYTDKLVLHRVVKRKMMIDAGRSEGFSDETLTSELNDIEQQIKSLSNSEYDSELKQAMNNWAAVNESQFYESQFLNQDTLANPEKHDTSAEGQMKTYLDLLPTNSDLIVDVYLVKTARLAFHSRQDASAALERLKAGESIDALARELEQDGEEYEAQKSTWIHSAVLSEPLEGEKIEVGTLFKLWFDNGSWHVHKALESKHDPVLLLEDFSAAVNNAPNAAFEQARERLARNRLELRIWSDSDVTVNGELLAFAHESFCGIPTLADNMIKGFR